MTDTLPKGLTVSAEGINSSLERLNGVDVADIAQLWRVYTTNASFVDDEAGSRLENFFWRIWSSTRIYKTLQGRTLARLFAHISDGSTSIRTTPVPSSPKQVAPRQGAELVTPLSDHPANSALHSPQQANPGSRSSSGTNNGKGKTPSHAARAPLPPPILKKGRADSDDPPKTTRILLPEPETATEIRPAQSQRRESEKNAPNHGRKKTVFVATAANSKRKSVLPRRKPSQSSSSTTPSATPSARQSPVLALVEGTPPAQEDLNLQRSNLASAITVSSSIKPTISSGSWQNTSSPLSLPFPSDLKSTTTSTNKSHTASNKTNSASTCESHPNQPSTDTLIDKDFRTRFAEKKIRELELSSSPNTTMAPPPRPQQSAQAPSSKKGEKQNPSSRMQSQISSSTPIYPQAETSSTTAPVSATPRRDGNVRTTTATPSPSVSSSKSQSQLSTLIEADRRKRMAGT